MFRDPRHILLWQSDTAFTNDEVVAHIRAAMIADAGIPVGHTMAVYRTALPSMFAMTWHPLSEAVQLALCLFPLEELEKKPALRLVIPEDPVPTMDAPDEENL